MSTERHADTEVPHLTRAVIPEALRVKGWKLTLSGGSFRAKNDRLQKYSSAYATADQAVTAAELLDQGKTQTNNSDGSVEFTEPTSQLPDFVIRCPECGDPNNLSPTFEGQKLVSFTCEEGHTFKGNETRPKSKSKQQKAKAQTISNPSSLHDDYNAELPVKDIVPSLTNARQVYDEQKLAELADSIKTRGVLEPLLVRPSGKGNKFELIAGERRLRASKIAGLDRVPCIVRKLSDQEAEEIQTIENDQREDLNPIERGAGYLKLIERHHHTPETLAAAVHKSKTFIHDQLKLAQLPERARKAMLAGKLPQSTATLIARIPSASYRENAAREIVRDFNPSYPLEPLSFREAKSLIERKYSTQLKGAPFSREDANLVPEAGPCATCPKLAGNNRVEFPEGRADVCTDPQCFNRKVAAHDARTRAMAKEKEIKVLPASTCKSLFSYGMLSHSAGYIDLGEQCHQDKQKKKRSYKQLLGDEAEPVLAINPRTHRAHYLVLAKEAAKILEKTHQIKIHVATTSSSSRSSKKSDPKAEAKQKLEEEIFERAVQLAGDELALQAEVNATTALKQIALIMLENTLGYVDNDSIEYAAKRRGLIGDSKKRALYPQTTKALTKFAESSPAETVLALSLELEFAEDVNRYNRTLSERSKKILKIFPRVATFDHYVKQAREEIETKAAATPPTNTKIKAAGAGK